MDRMENNYCWYTVKDWQKAQGMGLGGIRGFLRGNEDENLFDVIDLASNNCLPL